MTSSLICNIIFIDDFQSTDVGLEASNDPITVNLVHNYQHAHIVVASKLASLPVLPILVNSVWSPHNSCTIRSKECGSQLSLVDIFISVVGNSTINFTVCHYKRTIPTQMMKHILVAVSLHQKFQTTSILHLLCPMYP